jgi:hemolysin activation/secretion protein
MYLLADKACVRLSQLTLHDKNRCKGLLAATLAVSAQLLPQHAFSQSTVPDPSLELRRQNAQREGLRRQMEAPAWEPPGQDQSQSPSQRLRNEQPCSHINQIVIEGLLSSDYLRSALNGPKGDDSPIGRCLGAENITILLQRTQQALIEQGYITSQIQAPEQDLTRGTLTLRVIEGRVASIRTRADHAGTPAILPWATKAGAVLNLHDIEQSLDNFRRLPSVQAKIQVEPGSEPGTSNLVVDFESQPPLRLGLSVDDAGNRSSGKLQGSATFSWDNPLGVADLLYLTQGADLGGRDPGPRGSSNQILHYSLPWGYWLVGATLSRNRYSQTVYGPYESYLYRGTSSQAELSVSSVLRRSGHSKTTVSVKAFTRQSSNFIDDLEVLVQRRRTSGWELVFQHMHFFSTGSLGAQLSIKHGTGAFGAQRAPEEATGDGTGRMRLMTGMLNWSSPFSAIGTAWEYSTQVQAQWAQTRLTPQDRFCIGGRSTVRGYDGQQSLCGDRGQLWRQEVAAAVPLVGTMLRKIQIYAGLDAGRAQTPGQTQAHRLSGLTLGWRGLLVARDRHLLQWEMFVGRPLHRPDDFPSSRFAAGFSLRAEF